MANTVHCDIISAEDEIFSGAVEIVIATGDLGELGILPGHAPLLTGIKSGAVVLRLEGGEEQTFYASGGYLEVQPGIVTILADTALRADDLDEAQAKLAQQKAEQELSDKAADFDFGAAQANLTEAAAQLRAIRKIREQATRR
ncbi:MAG: F0F1 ATP synthase subunit epsilon [Gammaproteobacteria bacterium]|nr:F0F1 ATP synthase subunit epsilon [Gammaproteobacteria bacterium]